MSQEQDPLRAKKSGANFPFGSGGGSPLFGSASADSPYPRSGNNRTEETGDLRLLCAASRGQATVFRLRENFYEADAELRSARIRLFAIPTGWLRFTPTQVRLRRDLEGKLKKALTRKSRFAREALEVQAVVDELYRHIGLPVPPDHHDLADPELAW